METLYLVALVLIFALAVFDLMVGVSNDAVNFLSSAVGAKAFSFKKILLIAALGIFVGASFSSGMMDIARHGIFQPQHFYFSEIMAIFIGVMIVDVILLDIFNSFGLPTSTTISRVFELLGGTFALALYKIYMVPNTPAFGDLINTEKAISMIFAIFLSVAIAFSFGSVVQFFVRLLFTFDFRKKMKYFIGVFGGLSFSSIIYFILFKGLKGSVFASSEWFHYMQNHSSVVLLILFVAFALLSQLFYFLHFNVFKGIVALGTFSLALAFAGNDLVNFIGVPLAALSSYQDFAANGNGAPDAFLMKSLMESAAGQWWILSLAGVIMMISLMTSKKAHNVIKTSVSLSAQGTADQAFGTNPVARAIVRWSHSTGELFTRYLPRRWRAWMELRRDDSKLTLEDESAAFDLVRASVNLMLASLLIAAGTAFKLPLSTTYVTFMVAMGTSLADKAWGRDTAVYRISGVLSVIGGWFFTAFAAFMSSFIVCFIVYKGGFVVSFILFGLVVLLLLRSTLHYKKKTQSVNPTEERYIQILSADTPEKASVLADAHFKEAWGWILIHAEDRYRDIISGFLNGDLTLLRKTNHSIDEEKIYARQLKRQGAACSQKMDPSVYLTKSFYLYQANDCVNDIVFNLDRICDPCLHHIDNHFTPLSKRRQKDLDAFWSKITDFIEDCARSVFDGNFSRYEELKTRAAEIGADVVEKRKSEMTTIREKEVASGAAVLYLTILYETKNLIDRSMYLTKVCKKFLANDNSK